jgi:hypothetical protein
MRRLAPFVSLLFLLLVGSSARAQESVVIDRGSITFTGSGADPSGQFQLEGPQMLTLTGGLREGNFNPSCLPCVAGQQLFVRSVFNGSSSIRAGWLSTASETRGVFYEGQLNFDSDLVTLPTRYSRLPFSVVVPVTLTGVIRVHGTDPFVNSNNLLFVVPIQLHGTATLKLRPYGINPTNGKPFYTFKGLSYDFPPPAEAN